MVRISPDEAAADQWWKALLALTARAASPNTQKLLIGRGQPASGVTLSAEVPHTDKTELITRHDTTPA